MKTIILFLLTVSLHSFNSEANIITRITEVTSGGSKALPNCDSEAIAELRSEEDYSDSYWESELERAVKKNKYCRQAQLWWHFYLVYPKKYREEDGYRKTIEALYKGEFFLELQWKIKHYRKEKGHDEAIDFLQVSSYWKHLEKKAGKACGYGKGYYPDGKSNYLSFLEEAYLSTNGFIKRYPESAHLSLVEEKRKEIKNLDALKKLCSAKSALKVLERRKIEKHPRNYWALYNRFALIVSLYQTSDALEEALVYLIKVNEKLESTTMIMPPNTYEEDRFLYKEDWQAKKDQLIQIYQEQFPNSTLLTETEL